MRTRPLSSLLLVLAFLTTNSSIPQALAYFPEDVTFPILVIPAATPEALTPAAKLPPLPAVQAVALGWNADATITRSTFVAAIVRRFFRPSERCFPKLSESDYSLLARDVEKDAPYGIDLCTAMRAGLMRGYSDGTFRPQARVTRAEAAKVLAKLFHLTADPSDPLEPWVSPYVSSLREAGALAPDVDLNAPITRGELSEMLWKLREKTGMLRETE
jgi:hypothetical protein